MDIFRSIAERKILEAMQDGAFERLEGEGKPIDLAENPFEDPSLRMGHRLLRNHGFAPAWIEESRDIDTQRRALEAEERSLRAAAARGAEREWVERKTAELRERAAALNRRIANFNLVAPAAACKWPAGAPGELP
jgi:DnaJ family protein C protein 28